VAVYADNPRRLPAPPAVLAMLAELALRGDLLYHLGVTLLRVACTSPNASIAAATSASATAQSATSPP
jgi:ABC-type nitrate/sulfonate/bicarbonate transport system permease component